MRHFLAIDLGASSGRHIVGATENGVMKTKEVYRFENGVIKGGGRLCWDIERIYVEVKNGIRAAFSEFDDIESLSIDTWGIDYVLTAGGETRVPCRAYRDGGTLKYIDEFIRLCHFPSFTRKQARSFRRLTPSISFTAICARNFWTARTAFS